METNTKNKINNKNTIILGLNSAYHESSACILKNGELIAFIEEERLNRFKHAKYAEIDTTDILPVDSINYCLKTAGVSFDDIDHIAYNFDPYARLKQSVDVDGNHKIFENQWGTEVGEKKFFDKNINVIKKLSVLFGRDVKKIFHFVGHHTAHASGTFYSSGFESAAILVVDGIAESHSTWLGIGKDSKITKLYDIDYPNSIGFMWEKMSEFLGFDEHDAEKVMGLASYGNFKNEIDAFQKLMRSTEDKKSFIVDNDIFLFRTGDFSEMEKLFGVPQRKIGEPITSKHHDIAAALQHTTEEIVLNLATELKKLTGETRLCMAGGTSLNVVSNGKLINSKIFNEVFIQPEANDAGGAIGAAFFVQANVLEGKTKPIKTAYLGPSFSNKYILGVLKKNPDLEFEFVPEIAKTTAKLLADGNLIAWLQGKMEAGPRALGHRSLLADPRTKNVIDLINIKVKLREYFRPLAPSVLEEELPNWFDVTLPIPDPARYMLMAMNAKKEKVHLIPAVVHVDGTSRAQAVNKETSPEYWDLINEFNKIAGVPMLLNTSFNIQEPIVCSPEDAIKTFKRSGIDFLVMENYLCKKKQS